MGLCERVSVATFEYDFDGDMVPLVEVVDDEGLKEFDTSTVISGVSDACE